MLSVSHAVIGATTGRFIPYPWVSFALNVIIHFPLDKVRHYLPEKKKQVYTLATVDTLLSIAFLVLLFFYKGEYRESMLAGALGGVAVDFTLILTPLFKAKVGKWHVSRQVHISKLKNLTIDFVILVLLFITWWLIK